MRLVFTKSAGKFDRLDLVTAAGPRPPIDCPKQGIIPHDMVHFAVETEVAAVGFLGGIAAGGDSGFRAGSDDAHQRSVERLVETLQAEMWSGGPADFDDLATLYATTCAARGDLPLALTPALVAAIRARITDLTARWQAVPVGGVLELELAGTLARDALPPAGVSA